MEQNKINLTADEKTELMYCWLKMYTNDVINKVLERSEEILSNTVNVQLLRQLYDYTKAEEREGHDELSFYFRGFTNQARVHNEYSIARAIREALYSLYIRGC